MPPQLDVYLPFLTKGGMQMRKDIKEKQLEEYPDVAADIIDGTLYDGKQVVKEEDLELVAGSAFTRDESDGVHERHRDLMFLDKVHGCHYVFYGIENQTDVDNTMPLRVIGYDYAAYAKQVKEYMDFNKQNKKSAYTKKIHTDQKLIPAITIVLFYGAEWSGPKTLLDMLDLKERQVLKPYLLDYKMNLIELGKDKELYKKFHSDFRYIVQYISVQDDKEALNAFLKQRIQDIRHTGEFLDVMSVIGKKMNYEVMEKNVLEYEKEDDNMVTIGEALVNRGIERGIECGIKQGIEQGIEQGIQALILDNRERGESEELIIKNLKKRFHLSEEEAIKYTERF